MRFFHVSRHDLGETVTMEVKLPWTCNIATEGDIPRICVSPIIHHCLRAVSSCVSNFTVNDALDHAKIETVFGESIEEYVERVPYIRGQSVYYTDERPFMPPASVDFRKNKEHWFLKNTEFKRAGYIDLDHLVNQRKVRVINDISEIESNVLLTLTQDVRVTSTTNVVEAFRETKFKEKENKMSESKLEHANYIIAAAARLKIGDDLYIIPSVRHLDELFHKNNEIYELGLKAKYPMFNMEEIRELFIKSEQGFVDRFGKFHNREEAWKIAEPAGQIRRRVGGDTINGGTLFSENLY